MHFFRVLRNEKGQWTLIGLVLAAAIIVALVVVLYGGAGGKLSPRSRLEQAEKETGTKVEVKPGQSVVGAVRDKSMDPVCQSNLRQIRAYLQMSQASDGQYPPTLEARKIGSGSILVCPLSKQPYSYDPSTGTVRCTTPGHEAF